MAFRRRSYRKRKRKFSRKYGRKQSFRGRRFATNQRWKKRSSTLSRWSRFKRKRPSLRTRWNIMPKRAWFNCYYEVTHQAAITDLAPFQYNSFRGNDLWDPFYGIGNFSAAGLATLVNAGYTWFQVLRSRCEVTLLNSTLATNYVEFGVTPLTQYHWTTDFPDTAYKCKQYPSSRWKTVLPQQNGSPIRVKTKPLRTCDFTWRGDPRVEKAGTRFEGAGHLFNASPAIRFYYLVWVNPIPAGQTFQINYRTRIYFQGYAHSPSARGEAAEGIEEDIDIEE